MATVYRQAALQAARIVGESTEMDVVVEKIAARARSLAAGHSVTGEYVNGLGTERIRGKRGVTDRIAYVDHEAAASIEFGHMTRGGRTGNPHWVDGLHIMRRAAGL